MKGYSFDTFLFKEEVINEVNNTAHSKIVELFLEFLYIQISTNPNLLYWISLSKLNLAMDFLSNVKLDITEV